MARIGLLAILIGVATIAVRPAIASDPPKAVDPIGEILADRCMGCHSAEAKKGKLDLSRRSTALLGGENGPAIVPGKPGEGALIEKIEAGEMPPGKPLPAEDVARFRTWIEAGANYPVEPILARRAGADWWALQPIKTAEPPAVKNSGWVRSPIDRFVLARLERDGFGPAPEADRATFLRRVTFDLIGLPPTPEDVKAFLGDDHPDAFERVVDRLLESPHYGERWGRHWLDVVRFAESHGYETNQLRMNAWPYRDYVIRAFNRDTPFARFVEEQFAGDAIPDADFLARSATGFLVGGAHDVVGNATPQGMLQQRADDLDDVIAASATSFLGLTVQCARCHDHKFDPISQKDYYALQAILSGVNHADRDILADDADSRRREAEGVRAQLAEIDRDLDQFEPIARPDLGAVGRAPVDSLRNVERFVPTEARFVRFTVQSTNNGIEPCLDELEVWTAGDSPRNVASASAGGKPTASSSYPGGELHKIEHLNDDRMGNSRSWISGVPGKGWAQVELAGVAVIDRVVWGRDREGKYQDRTPVEYYIEVATEPGRWRVVASSADRAPIGSRPAEGNSKEGEELRRRREELRTKLGTLDSGTVRVYAGTFSEPGPTRVLRRGDPSQPLDPVAPAALKSVRPPLEMAAETPEVERRRALARWIGDPANPLPPRVFVNRLWQHHFGRGIVGSPSDFGFNGDRPSHPELLDWLAAEFLANGGRSKPIHRLIVLSAAYRQSSRPNEKAQALDGANRTLWRMSPRRLEAEEIRDAMLAVAGTLDLRIGGPGYNVWEPNTNYVAVFTPRSDLGPETFRRMVYQFRPRSRTDPTFGLFDCPDGGLVAPRRESSTTALQALGLLNSRVVLDQAGRFASRLAKEAGNDPEAQAALAFRLAFGREPSEAEKKAATAVIRDHGAATFCRAIFNANEFLYVN